MHLRSASAPDRDGRCLGRAARARRPSCRAHRLARSLRAGRRVLPMGICDGCDGAVLGVNPFDQPDVEESEDRDAAAGDGIRKTGKLPDEAPLSRSRTVAVRRSRNPSALGSARSRRSCSRLAGQLQQGDYFALLAFIEMNERAPQRARGHSRSGSRSHEGRDDGRIRAAISALDRPGAQGRAEHRCVSADHVRRSRRTCPCPGSATASARSSWRRRAATSKCSRRAAGACFGSI